MNENITLVLPVDILDDLITLLIVVEKTTPMLSDAQDARRLRDAVEVADPRETKL